MKKIIQPGFDHNLRNHHGDTRVMVACCTGNTDVVLLLLQSAVYPQSFVDDDDHLDTFSDNDSGVLDEDLIRTTSQRDNSPTTYQIINPDPSRKATRTEKVEALPSRVDTLLLDIDKPIGLSIYHDGLVSHVYAINTTDGSTAFHRCVQKGDNFRIMELLLKIDDTCINIQNSSGLNPLHLACQLDRRHCVDKLLGCVEVDLNILTLDGNLPEEMTNNKHIIKALQRCRKGNPVRCKAASRSRSSSITNVSTFGQPVRTEAPSTINLEKVRSRFEAMKQNRHKDS